jgi:hypothetical protein
VKNRATQSALLVAGAAAGAAAATWFGKRRLTAVNSEADEVVEPGSAELPVGRSADPDIDATLSRTLLPQDETSGAALLGEPETTGELPSIARSTNASLDGIWDAAPSFAEGEQTEGYDAVAPEDLGSVWLERATQTTHDERPQLDDPSDASALEDLGVSEASRASSRPLDEDDDEIADDDLDDDPETRNRSSR